MTSPRTQEELAGLAHKFLTEWSAVEDHPIDIEHYLEKHHKIKCLPSYEMPALCNEGGSVALDGTRIYLDPRNYKDPKFAFRLRMTIAHEFGHLRLHSNVFARLSSEQDIQELLKFFTDNTGVADQYEIQAFTLAGYILVPEETIAKVTKKVASEMSARYRQKSGKDLDLASNEVWRVVAGEVARRYEVTPQAVTKRLQWSGLWGRPLST